MLRDHPAVADAEHPARRPPHGVEQRDDVVGDVGHRVRRRRDVARAHAPMVERDEVETFRPTIEHRFDVGEPPARAVHVQQSRRPRVAGHPVPEATPRAFEREHDQTLPVRAHTIDL